MTLETHTRRNVHEAIEDFEERMDDWLVDVECAELGCESAATFAVQLDLSKPSDVAHRCWEHGKDEPHKVIYTCCACERTQLDLMLENHRFGGAGNG